MTTSQSESFPVSIPVRRHFITAASILCSFLVAAVWVTAVGTSPALVYFCWGVVFALAVAALSSWISVCSAKKFERELYQRELDLIQTSTIATERYQLLTNNLAAAVIVRDLEGKILYCSPYSEVLTGYAVSQILQSQNDFFESIVHEEDLSKYIRSLQVTKHGEPFQFRYRFWHKSGILMWAESRTVPILDDDGTVISSLSITLDVTGNVRYQRQVEEKNKELHDFTYMVSHDLKAPIFTLKGMLGILVEELGTSPPEPISEPLDHIHRALHRLEQLVTSVLEYSRASTFEPKHEQIDVHALMLEVLEDYKPALSAAGGKVSLHGTLTPVIGDNLRLVQVFSNILGNAIKYRSPLRPLEIRIEAQPGFEPKTTQIVVSDNGMGVPPDKLDAIFRPFQRLHGKEIEGSGIGLACVRKLLERLGGEIEAESDGVSGSKFIVTLPAAVV